MINYDLLNKFKDHLLINGKSYSTIRVYVKRVEEFLRNRDTTDFEKAVNDFILKLRENKKPTTINGYINALKSYTNFLKIKIIFPHDAKIDSKLPDSFDEKYFEDEIISVVEQTSSEPIKMKAVLYFLFYSGLRIGEMNLIKRKDFDLDNNSVRVYIPKTREERIVFYDNKVRDILKMFFEIEVEIDNAFNMTSVQIQNYIYSIKSHFTDIKLRPHLFRHSYATNLLKNGADLLTVSKLLGHHNTKTTERYLNVTSDFMKEVYLKNIHAKEENQND